MRDSTWLSLTPHGPWVRAPRRLAAWLKQHGHIIGVVVIRVERWEPDWTISPGEILREWIDEHDTSEFRTAVACDIEPGVLRGILDDSQPITRRKARKLARGTGISAALWLNPEDRHRR